MGCCTVCRPENEVDEEVEDMKEESKNLDGGHIGKRKCRDLIWLLAFIVFWVGMVIIAGFSFQNGNPERLLFGTDSWGNICGNKNERLIDSDNSGLDLTDFRNLYFHDPTAVGADDIKICVTTCPEDVSASDLVTCSTNLATCQAAGVCVGTNNPYTQGANDAGGGGNGCPTVLYSTERIIPGLRRCIPLTTLANQAAGYAAAFFDEVNAVEILQKVVSDFGHAWRRIIYAAVLACGISLITIVLMRCLVAPIIYTLIFLALALLVAATAFVGYQWDTLRDELNATPEDEQLDEERRNVRVFLGLFITCCVITGVIILVVIAMRNRIRLSIAVFEETSKAIFWMPLVYVLPIATYACLLLFGSYWIAVYLYLATSKEAVIDSNGRAVFVEDLDLKRMFWYHLFGLLWSSQFILACSQLVLAGCFTTWYFTRDKRLSTFPIIGSIYRLIRYHLGSVALGSLVVAIIQFIRVILSYIKKKAKKKSKIAEYILKCLICCMWCFEKCMKFLNKNAYIEIAIFGFSFCSAAKQAFFTLLHNAFRVAVLNGIAGFVLFMLKVFIVALTAIVSLEWLRDDEELNYYGVVLIVIAIFSWFVADTFLDVYKMGADAILISFCEDEKRNDGSTAKPYYAPDRFRKFLKKSAKETEDEDPEP